MLTCTCICLYLFFDSLYFQPHALFRFFGNDFGKQRILFFLNDEIAVDKAIADFFCKQHARGTFPGRRHADQHDIFHKNHYKSAAENCQMRKGAYHFENEFILEFFCVSLDKSSFSEYNDVVNFLSRRPL